MLSLGPCDKKPGAFSSKMLPLTSFITLHILQKTLSKDSSPHINLAHVTTWEFERVRNCYFSKLVKAHRVVARDIALK